MRAHPSADNWRTLQVLKVVNYVGFRVMDSTSEITPGKKHLFLSEKMLLTKVCDALLWISTQRALIRTIVHLDLKIHIEINHGNSKTVLQRIRFMQYSPCRKICLGKEPLCHDPGDRPRRSVLGTESNSCRQEKHCRQGQLYKQPLTFAFTGQTMLQG